jgi:hypothetical protein
MITALVLLILVIMLPDVSFHLLTAMTAMPAPMMLATTLLDAITPI